jgi:hypothetical protein
MKMNIEMRLKAFTTLGNWMLHHLMENEPLLLQVYFHNRWFTIENTRKAIDAIARNFLNDAALRQWTSAYPYSEPAVPKRVGLIMAGNLPLAGFHDLLCVLVAGHAAVIKLSSKDKILLPAITAQLIEIEPRFKPLVIYADVLKQPDAVIATGGNNSSRYFEYYFGKYPHIIRKNRNSLAVLTGSETDDELVQLGHDVFQYFGLGCRNVSMLLVPENYSFQHLLSLWEKHFAHLMNEDPYKNNYDYNRTLLLMNKISHLATDFVMLYESPLPASPISCLHYKFYNSVGDAEKFIAENSEQIQCVVSSDAIAHAIPFGSSQQPRLTDYADGADTLKFLTALTGN